MRDRGNVGAILEYGDWKQIVNVVALIVYWQLQLHCFTQPMLWGAYIWDKAYNIIRK